MSAKQHPLGFCTCRTHVERPWNRPEHWSGAETAYLEAWYGRKPDASISAHLGRSVVALRLKARRLGLRKKDAGYTARELGRLFGVDATTIIKQWVRRGLLPSTRAYRQGPHPIHIFRHEDVEAFLEEHGEWVEHHKVPADSPFRQLVDVNTWYSLPELVRLTGRRNLDLDIKAGLIAARKRGAWWMVPASEVPKIRRLADEHIPEAVWRYEQGLAVRRNRRKLERAA